MYLKKNFPYIASGYIIAVGLFFCVSALVEGALLDPEPPGRHIVLAVSTIFIVSGIYSICLFKQGKLKKSGKSTTEVRQGAIEKLKDPAMLAQIALEDQNPEIRKTAEKRLGEISK